MTLTPKQLHILQHSLGVDEHGQGEQYRNRYVVDPGDHDIDALVSSGLMVDRGSMGELTAGMHVYMVTDAGKLSMRRESSPPPKLTRSQTRYRKYLKEGSSLTFGEWLRQQKVRRKEGYVVP
jgi:hypothetical protein